MIPAVPELVRLVAGLVILYQAVTTLSITELADTQTNPSTVLPANLLVVLCPAAASPLRIVAVILRAAQSPLVVADLGLLDEGVSTLPDVRHLQSPIFEGHITAVAAFQFITIRTEYSFLGVAGLHVVTELIVAPVRPGFKSTLISH